MRFLSLFALAFAGAAALFSGEAKASGDALAFYQTPAVSAPVASTSRAGGKRANRVERSVARDTVRGGGASGTVASLARQQGVPVSLALAVCHVESRCRFGLVGAAGERGPLQIKLATARGLGYSGSAAGLNGHAGAYWGMRHLAVAYNKCGTARGAARLHNAGLGASCGGSGYASRVVAAM